MCLVIQIVRGHDHTASSPRRRPPTQGWGSIALHYALPWKGRLSIRDAHPKTLQTMEAGVSERDGASGPGLITDQEDTPPEQPGPP
jgi:hypothetical protein